MDESTGGIGRRLREIRAWRGLSLRVAAELAGISAPYLSRIERGERPVDNRRLISALADALAVSPSELIGHPARWNDPAMAAAQATVPAVRLALIADRLGGRPAAGGSGRDVRLLSAEAERAVELRSACDLPAMGAMLPALVADLQNVAATSRGDDRIAALEGLMHGYATAMTLLHMLGYQMEAWEAATKSAEVAAELGGGWPSVAAFTLTHALLPMGTEAQEHAYRTASEAADAARDVTGQVQGDPALGAYGSLCVVSGLAAAATSRDAEAAERIAEAQQVAQRVGECSPTVATFGPTNVAMYQMKGALEVGDFERAAQLGGRIKPDQITSAERRAMYWIDYGRALARMRGRQQEAVEAFRSGERCAPLRVRGNVYAREAVADLLGRARRDAVGRELRGMAYRMGISA
ncbi:MAG: helix-turn-helix domain-containing protein [Actinomycetota bacterium]|nr:helix-turn-helix domain-containing protein [Actinomycetota bacterium]